MSNEDITNLYASLPITPNSSCIRVLRVLAPSAPNTYHEPIHCELHVADLSSKPAFSALSYVWGTTATPPECIFCNGVGISVTTNCYIALWRLRNLLGSFTIWVDAVCIDQTNEADKIQQIELMGSIYANASTTYIWLGDGISTTEKVFDYLSHAGLLRFFFDRPYYQLGRTVKPRPWSAVLFYFFTRWSFKRNIFPYHTRASYKNPGASPHLFRNYLRSSHGPSFEEIEMELGRAWINRIWTYQEAVLANNPVVVSGSSLISWNRFAISMVFLNTMSKDFHLSQWLDIVFHRALFQTNGCVQEFTLSELTAYWDFCAAVANIHGRCSWISFTVISTFELTVFCILIILTILYRTGSLPNTHETQRTVTELFIVNASLFGLWVIYWGISHYFAPSPSYPVSAWFVQAREKHVIRISKNNIHERIFDTIMARQAKNPKDFSFGIHSVLNRFSTPNLSLPSIDYSLPVGEVYTQLTVYLIRKTRTLRPLELARRNSDTSIPSWVPDYSQGHGSFGLLSDISTASLSEWHSREGPPNLKPHWKLFLDQKLLMVRGRKIGLVTESHKFRHTSDAYYDSEDDAHEFNLRLMISWRSIRQRGHRGQSFKAFDEFLQLIFGPKSSLPGAPQLSPLHLYAYTRLLAKHQPFESKDLFLGLMGRKPIRRGLLYGLGSGDGIKQRFVSRTEIFQTHITVANYLASSGLRLINTQNRAATSLENVVVGDTIYKIQGLSLPLAMRPNENNFRIIARLDFWGYLHEIKTKVPDNGDSMPLESHWEQIWIS